MTREVKWGLCATVKASAKDILRFAAFHLSAGAHRVHIFLDAPNPDAFAHLKAHPKCRVTLCDDTYWRRRGGKPPVKHQVRQSRNATHCYQRASDLDWLIHMDVDEFLIAEKPLWQHLSQLPVTCLTARIRPMEALAQLQPTGETMAFKRFVPNGPDRLSTVKALYPTYGQYVRGGFLSHVAGKLLVRTGRNDIEVRIHNIFQSDTMNPAEAALTDVTLAHVHAATWDTWRAAYDYRHIKGAYRADLAPAESGGVTLHDFLAQLVQSRGDSGLRHFFDEVCADTPDHRARLQAHDLLAEHRLDLDAHVNQHFPDFTGG
ncbi:glycosyltransferase family 2 protein [uncultured Roseobacter sp.]|uniref:glycosyltransferase family 2 protein n=1 Tax=uncultured Roseobacter sp. TaxID=114847 RepID=UPI00262FEAC7|nr:glycosyltransferase family 2 protein [uncultured Roseobacter sp.]